MTKQIEGDSIQKNKPKILFWDVETSLIVATTFTLYPERLPHSGILEDWSIICAAWKWAGDPATYHDSVAKYGNDKALCKRMREVLIQADIIVHHNGDKFDIKKFNARLIYHNLPPLPKLVTVDTLKHVKKIAQFTCNRLDYLGTHLLGEGKLHTSQDLWLKVRKGDKAAKAKMITYNVQDVVVLEKVHDRLRPYMQSYPHIGMITGGVKQDCPKCGSIWMQKRGTRITAAGTKFLRLQCQDCGSYHSISVTKKNGN